MRAYRAGGKSVVFVSHDMDLVARLAERVIVFQKGRKVYEGDKRTLFQNTQLLKESGLEQPRLWTYMNNLKRRGFNVRRHVWTVAEAKAELSRQIM